MTCGIFDEGSGEGSYIMIRTQAGQWDFVGAEESPNTKTQSYRIESKVLLGLPNTL